MRIVALIAFALSTLVARSAPGITTAWGKHEARASVDSERAIIAYDRRARLETLILQLRLRSVGDRTYSVVATAGRPTITKVPAEIFEQVTSLRADTSAPAGGGSFPPPSVAKVFAAKDGGAIEGWLSDENLATATKFRAWLDRLVEGSYVSFIEVPRDSSLVTARLAFSAYQPTYPHSAPFVAGAKWPTLELHLLAETPLAWSAESPREGSGFTRLSGDYRPQVDVELPGNVVSERLSDDVAVALGMERPPSTLWLGRYTVARVDRSRTSDARFTVSAHRRADEKVTLLGPPFGSASTATSAAPSASVTIPLDRAEQGATLGSKRRRTRWGQSSVGGAAILILGIGAVLWYLYKRKVG